MSTVRLTGWLICACGVIGAIAMAIGAWTLAPDRQEIAPTSISYGAGVAYVIDLPDDRYRILRASRDAFVLLPSPMRLLEDGRAIGWPVQTFDEVAEKGGGRFAYVHPVVAFSASDGSDPRTNGRAYSIERPIKPRLAAWCVAALAVLIGSGLAFPDRMRSTAIALLRVGPSPDIASRAGDINRGWLASFAVLAVTTLLAVAELLMMWWASASTQFAYCELSSGQRRARLLQLRSVDRRHRSAECIGELERLVRPPDTLPISIEFSSRPCRMAAECRAAGTGSSDRIVGWRAVAGAAAKLRVDYCDPDNTGSAGIRTRSSARQLRDRGFRPARGADSAGALAVGRERSRDLHPAHWCWACSCSASAWRCVRVRCSRCRCCFCGYG